MKLIIAIVNDDDAVNVSTALNKSGISVTKLATTGGYLKAGNTTFLIGLDDHMVDRAVEIIGNNAKKRTTTLNDVSPYGKGGTPLEITVGGATVFVLPVDQFLKL